MPVPADVLYYSRAGRPVLRARAGSSFRTLAARPVVRGEAEALLDEDVAADPVGFAEHLGGGGQADRVTGGMGMTGQSLPWMTLAMTAGSAKSVLVGVGARGEVEGGRVAVEVFVVLRHAGEDVDVIGFEEGGAGAAVGGDDLDAAADRLGERVGGWRRWG